MWDMAPPPPLPSNPKSLRQAVVLGAKAAAAVAAARARGLAKAASIAASSATSDTEGLGSGDGDGQSQWGDVLCGSLTFDADQSTNDKEEAGGSGKANEGGKNKEEGKPQGGFFSAPSMLTGFLGFGGAKAKAPPQKAKEEEVDEDETYDDYEDDEILEQSNKILLGASKKSKSTAKAKKAFASVSAKKSTKFEVEEDEDDANSDEEVHSLYFDVGPYCVTVFCCVGQAVADRALQKQIKAAEKELERLQLLAKGGGGRMGKGVREKRGYGTLVCDHLRSCLVMLYQHLSLSFSLIGRL